MPTNTPVLSHSIVVVGDMNPTIFQPEWFARMNLLGEDETESAKLKLIHPDLSGFEIEPWLNIQVVRHRFVSTTTSEAHFETMKDLISGVFRILEFTPVRALGLNFENHVEMHEETVERILEAAAPMQYLNAKLGNALFQSLITQLPRESKYVPETFVRLTMQESNVVKSGIHFNYNGHFQITSDENKVDGSIIAHIIDNEWNTVRSDFMKTIKEIIE